jgi:hypothetical protein
MLLLMVALAVLGWHLVFLDHQFFTLVVVVVGYL